MRFKVILLLAASLFLVVLLRPVMADSASTCQTKIEGDADCNGTVDFTDYFYLVQDISGIHMPPGVSADFNQDGKVDYNDRNIIVTRLGGTPQAFFRFIQRMVASVAKFRI